MRFDRCNKEFIESFDKPLRYAYFVLMSLLFCLILFKLLFYQADFMVISNESLAYRFFYSIRLHQGPDAGAWLPQGHLITSVHHIITWFLIKTGGLSDLDSLRESLNLFSFSSIAFGCFIVCSIFFASTKISYIGWKERNLLALTALAPVFFVRQGYYAAFTQPDYYHLNIVLIVLAVFLFQITWFYPRDYRMPFSLKACAGAGFFAGILASNKVSMLVIGFPLLGLMAFSSSVFSCKDVMRRIFLMAICSFLAFSFIFMAAGQFQIDWLKNTLPGWLDFIRDPGSDLDFMERFWERLINFSPAFLLLSIALIMIFYEYQEKYLLKLKAVKYTLLLAAVFCMYFLWKRPAFTTFCEIANISFGLAAIAATVISEKKWMNRVLPAILLIVLSQYYWENSCKKAGVYSSSEEAKKNWSIIKKFQKDTPTFCIIPDDRYQWRDPFILLLKGSSDFPTWTISENGNQLLSKLHFSKLIYYTEQSSDSVASKKLTKESLAKLLDLKKGVVFWADPDGFPPVTELYPLLREGIQKPGVKFTSEYLPLSKVTVNILEINSKSP